MTRIWQRRGREPGSHAKSGEALRQAVGALQRQRAERWRALARAARDHGNADAATAFEDLAARVEAAALADAETTLDADAVAAVMAPWQDAAVGELGGLYLLDRYRVMRAAVESEETLLRVLTEIAAAVRQTDARLAAEALAKDTIGRLAELRLERLRAFGARGPGIGPVRSDQVRRVSASAQALAGHAGDRERHAAERLAALAAAIADTDAVSAVLLRELAHDRAAGAVERGAASGPSTELTPPVPQAPFAALLDGLRLTDAGFRFYVAVADAAGDPAVVEEAQVLARGAVAHLRRLHARLDVLRGVTPLE
ncbi:MAG: hypothetical protein QNJ94_22610 [Alphaproteobacteria bacterium]|nr:hypothetical protein [Alphaproteobacteria bacterium]